MRDIPLPKIVAIAACITAVITVAVFLLSSPREDHYSTADYLRVLRSSDTLAKRTALSSLEGTNLTDENLIRILSNLLRDPDSVVRARAASALAGSGRVAVAPLMQALKDEDPDVKKASLEALGKIGDPNSLEALYEMFIKSEEPLRYQVLKSIVKFGPPAIPFLVQTLKKKDYHLRLYATTGLGEIRDAEVVPPLLEALRDSDYTVRLNAVRSLGKVGDVRATESLINLLQSSDERMRVLSVRALGRIGGFRALSALVKLGSPEAVEALKMNSRQAVSEFTQRLNDDALDVRIQSLQALALLGPRAESAAQAISALLQENDPIIRLHCIRALGEIGPGAKDAAPLLISVLQQSGSDLAQAAANALVKLGPRGIIALKELQNDPDESIRRVVDAALADVNVLKILEQQHKPLKEQREEALRALVADLSNKDWRIRDHAVRKLGSMQTEAARAVPSILRMLKDPIVFVRQDAAEALRSIGTTDAINGLKRAIDSGNANLSATPADLVTELGLKEAIAVLVDALEVGHISAAEVLAQIGPEAVPALLILLKHREPQVRVYALNTLADIGPEAHTATGEIRRLLGDPDASVRSAAAYALKSIGTDRPR